MNIEYVKEGLTVPGMETIVSYWEFEGFVIHWFRDNQEIAMATLKPNGSDYQWTRLSVSIRDQGIFTAAHEFSLKAVSDGYSLSIIADVNQNQFYKETGFVDRGDGFIELSDLKTAHDWHIAHT